MRARKRNPWLYGGGYDRRQARRLRRRAARRQAEVVDQLRALARKATS